MTHLVRAERQIDAPPAAIYAILADYHDGHRRIVPPRAFLWLAVERGGIGAGTGIRFAMRAFGSTRVSRGDVSEPEPGRVLVERYPDSGIVTSFIVDPLRGGVAAMATIATELPVGAGLIGRVQGWLFSRYLQPLYGEELERLADLAEGRRQHEPVPAKEPA